MIEAVIHSKYLFVLEQSASSILLKKDLSMKGNTMMYNCCSHNITNYGEIYKTALHNHGSFNRRVKMAGLNFAATGLWASKNIKISENISGVMVWATPG